jgi:protein gp37
MSESTNIEWADSTFNPWIGCTKVSPGCDACYAAVSTPARTMKVGWGVGQPRHRTSEAAWKEPARWNRKRFMECTKCGWRGECAAELIGCGACGSIDDLVDTRRRVFCASLADVFDNEVDKAWRADLFKVIRSTQNLDWLLLTKRIGNADRMMREAMPLPPRIVDWPWPQTEVWAPPSNVWLGATIVNQEEADRDIPKLLATPARLRFLSVEPMLGPVDISEWLWGRDQPCAPCPKDEDCDCGWEPRHKLDGEAALHWVICGGESGRNARPVHPDWARSLRDQCEAAGVQFLFKQWGEWVPYEESAQPPFYHSQHGHEIDGHALPDFESDDGRSQREWHRDFVDMILARRVGKAAAGRLLDGVQHDGYPEFRNA